MGRQNKTSWLDEPAFISAGASSGLVSRVDLDAVTNKHNKGMNAVHSLFNVGVSDLNESGDSAPVEEALSLFDQLSSQLTSSYRNLENRVSQLKTELSEEETHRQEQFEEKEKLANRLSTLLEILPAGVVLLDENGLVSECNPAAIDLLGEPLEGQAWLDVIKRSFSPRHDDGHEVSLKDGRRVRIETRSMASGPGQLVLLSDLTETRLLQEQVSRAERLSSLGKMVASLAHQIRTPLSAAMLYAGHLCQSKIQDSMRIDCADKLMSRLTHLEHQIRDMLIFAKGDTRLAECLSVTEFFESVQAASESVLEKYQVDCTWEIQVTNKNIMCNKDALVGACLNLINNSIEAVPQGQDHDKAFKLHICLKTKGSSSVQLTVKDNGPGIPQNIRQKVFEPFYTTKAQGTGLGLSVVQAVAKAHKGSFSIRSGKNGSSATVSIPIYESAATLSTQDCEHFANSNRSDIKE